MQIKRRFILISLGFGILAWIVDAVFDAFLFFDGSFLDHLIFDLPAHEFYIRTAILGIMLVFGMIAAEIVTDFETSQRKLSRFNKAAEEAGHAIYITDADGTIEYVNPAFEEITGFAEVEVIGENPRILKSGEMPDSYYVEIWETLNDGGVWEEEVINRRKNGELYHARQTISTITNEEGNIEAFVAIQSDITERKELEDNLRETIHQLEVMDRVIRHNVHNDMNLIQGYAALIKEKFDGEAAEFASIVTKESDELVQTIDKIQEITAILAESPVLETFDLVPILREYVAEFRKNHPDASIQSSIPDAAPVRATDHVYRAIEELVTNAVIHSDRETPTVQIDVEVIGDTTSIHIVDDGPGIPDDERRIITDQAEISPLYHGSGLGLWLVNLIVKESNGTLGIEENNSSGSIVTIEVMSG